jgi:hypothetical protein
MLLAAPNKNIERASGKPILIFLDNKAALLSSPSIAGMYVAGFAMHRDRRRARI